MILTSAKELRAWSVRITMDDSIVIILIWVILAIVVFVPVLVATVITGVDISIHARVAKPITIPTLGV
jgi:hypothetical protein